MSAPLDHRPSRPTGEADRIARLRLQRSRNVGAVTWGQLMARFGDAARALDALPGLARRGGREIAPAPEAAALEEIAAGEALGARLIFLGEADYPPALAVIPDPPPSIWALGDARALLRPAIAMVGARNASAAGRAYARALAADLGAAGFSVVSGLARGIDAAAHEGSLATGSLACVAGGVDIVYPPENAALRTRVMETGAVISEEPPGLRPIARHFPKRNRLIAGLSRGVVVVEAAERSGSLITARLALEYDRDVFAVPGFPSDPRSAGGNRLLRQGAQMVERAEDVVAALSAQMVRPRRLSDAAFAPECEIAWEWDPPPAPEAEDHEPERPPHGPPPTARPDAAAPDGLRERMAAAIGHAPVEIDALIRELGCEAGEAQTALLELELAGRVERQPGQRVARAEP